LNSLDLYASIEEHLDFKDEVKVLHTKMKDLVLSKNPKTLIDIGCGQGNFCQLLIENGVDTLGIDLSKKQIEIANSKNIDAKCIDIKDVSLRYNCATAVFDVVNYLKQEDIKGFLLNVYNILNNNGHFIFDVNSLYGFQEVAPGSLIIENSDKRFLAIDANFNENILDTDIILFEKENKNNYIKSKETIKQYFYTPQELQDLLESVGFINIEIIDFTLHSDYEADDKYIFICKKKIKFN
jgi:SAM-dependent methyltransferase